MLVTKASPKNVKDTLEFSVTDLVKTVLYVCAPEAKMPAKLPNPPQMQKWLESMGVKNYIAAAPPPIARIRDQK
jgi:antitoxin component of RelBE/YafQ-DinJ toxin-antitoxin module